MKKTVENLTPEVGALSFIETPNSVEYVLSLGNMKKGSQKSFNLLIKDAKHMKLNIGCPSCTKASILEEGDDIKMTITYTAQTKGMFEKSVTELLTTGEQIRIKLKGQVQ